MKKLTLITAIILTANLLFAQIINIPDDYPTIQQGINAAIDGDTVLVQPGTYTENIGIGGDITLASLFLFTQDTSYISSTIIDGNQEGTVIDMHQLGFSSHNITVTGFTIKNGLGDEGPAYCGGGINYYQWATIPIEDNITLKNLIITDNNTDGHGGGICINSWEYDSLSNIIIQDVSIIGNRGNAGAGIWCENSSATLQNVKMHNNHGFVWWAEAQVFFLNSNSTLLNVTYSSNYSYKSVPSPRIRFENSNSFIQNSTFLFNNNGDRGYYEIECTSSNVTITNSIIWGNNDLISLQESSSLTISFTDIKGGEASISTSSNCTLNWLGGNIDEDPLFIGSGNHPFQLSAGSPCIDAGTPDTTGLNLPGEDIIGNVRIWDGNGNGVAIIDMGAYEFGALPVGIENPVVRSFPERVPLAEVQCIPNPVSENCSIEFELLKPALVSLKIFGRMGRELAELENRWMPAGHQQIKWTADILPEGVYFCRRQAGSEVVVKKIIKN